MQTPSYIAPPPPSHPGPTVLQVNSAPSERAALGSERCIRADNHLNLKLPQNGPKEGKKEEKKQQLGVVSVLERLLSQVLVAVAPSLPPHPRFNPSPSFKSSFQLIGSLSRARLCKFITTQQYSAATGSGGGGWGWVGAVAVVEKKVFTTSIVWQHLPYRGLV